MPNENDNQKRAKNGNSTTSLITQLFIFGQLFKYWSLSTFQRIHIWVCLYKHCISLFFFVFAGAHVVRPKKGKAVWALHGGWRKNEVKLYTIHYDVYTFPIKLLLMTTIAHCNRQGMVRGWKIVSDDRIKLKSETFSAGLCWEWCILFFCCCWAGTHTHTPWKTFMFI